MTNLQKAARAWFVYVDKHGYKHNANHTFLRLQRNLRAALDEPCDRCGVVDGHEGWCRND